MSQNVRVVVVGAGPAGLTAAIGLALRGIECLVLERRPRPYPLPRAVHFDDEVFRILAGLGLGERVRAISRPAAGMQLVDTRLRPLAEFTRDAAGGPHGHPQANMFDQPELDAVLRERLGEMPKAVLREGAEVTAIEDDGGPLRVRYRDAATGEESVVRADAVLGCDGANSPTREVIGATMRDLGFEQRWLVVDARSPRPLVAYDGVQQVCDPDRAATFMMVTPGRYRWEFRLPPAEPGDAELDDDAVLALIRPWLGEVAPEELTLTRRAWYTFRGAVADRWRAGRVFLLGDAAHLTPPFIGQGMGAGVRDAANLAWKLALVLDGLADDRLLDTYRAERLPHARRMIRLAVIVGRIMTGGSARTARLRRVALKLATRLPGIEGKVLDTAWPAFPAGPLTAGRDRAAGKLCPQPLVRTPTGEAGLDELLGDGFAILGPPGCRAAVEAFDTATRDYFDALGTRVVELGEDAVVDVDGSLATLLHSRAGTLLLRPDRVIVASAAGPDLRVWRRLLERAGISGAPKRADTC
ncbi:bifunctional 3-(3-hydroxy-phenyl)propionate/3-hydroxycinnamic acid hydroxylase [Phytomonospora sp. NPDC050363]|uniref:bifunctional 3-(3-hydroxy-phenyl)propionate/3-hydroxycinnamic acid hydroxylase MhpA n=1 Tax=Phytomonospora sp. NPDC050363 TaxID=3155642 RepID=UPI0033EA7B5F